MADIKTREIDRTPKIRDAASKLPKELVRDIAEKSVDFVKSSASPVSKENGENTLSEDAGNRLEHGIDWTADHGGRAVWSGGKKAVQMASRRKKNQENDCGTEEGFRSEVRNGTGRDSGTGSGSRLPTERMSGAPGKQVEEFQLSARISAGNSALTAEGLADLTGMNGESEQLVTREHTAERMQIRTKEEAQLATGRFQSSGRETYERAGRVSPSPAERIKLKGQMERTAGSGLGKGTFATEQNGQKTFQAGKQLAVRGRHAAGKTVKTAKGAKRGVSRVKTTVKTVVTAVRSVLAMVSGGAVVILLVVILGVIGGIAGLSGSGSAEPLSQEVLAYTATIQKYASQYGIPEYVASLQAIMMQESGGRGTDPMQASECPYNTRYPNTPGAIQDPEYSIQVGVQYFADCVEQAGCENPADLDRLQLSWQGYNYGNGYIGWALENYGGYSLENALLFSQQQAVAHGRTGYGDPEYVPHVQRYYSGGNIFAGLFGNQRIVNIAKNEVGESNGEKYWSWYGFEGEVEWCACFVSWCGDQAGLIEIGAMPRFSLCSDGMAWFQSQGKWQDGGTTPSAGSLIFYDWDGDGVADHVGIVEKCENGVVYTVEGNTTTGVNGVRIRGVWQHQYDVKSGYIMGYGF